MLKYKGHVCWAGHAVMCSEHICVHGSYLVLKSPGRYRTVSYSEDYDDSTEGDEGSGGLWEERLYSNSSVVGTLV